MTLTDGIILALAVLIVAGSLAAWLWRRRHGKTGCGGSCPGCPHADRCERADRERK